MWLLKNAEFDKEDKVETGLKRVVFYNEGQMKTM